ncbi:hypothetical protein [Brytella acorum]|uniref:Uncharacterized protein n=1 Tax=Brytella acorum TaxID=2959299 RepID=A0AA35Y3U0_9PROT|nr:hypothetical protein [Brytella acorum]MDF3624250.1 hypothetical protein [Brytella acorum]CAI9121176.1 hypothetical protein LMG32879_002022 [Brytella acorum]
MAMLRYALPLAAILTALPAAAQTTTSPGTPAPTRPTTQGQTPANGGVEYRGSGEHVTAKGRHTLPPGYQDAPSTEFQHGPDPDHLDKIQRDAVTGADLSKFGSAYGASNPTQSGQLGDATGNGWVAPR